ncbi:MAG: hypothetical protein QOD07_2867 [Frankiaceae bacterium]|jgi:hypothetical protein|nr:hypothetical protein [Frankiaceae bacterium]
MAAVVPQTILTFLTTIEPARLEPLKALLAAIDAYDPAGEWPPLPFAALSRLHFTSLVVLEDGEDGFEPYLVFEHNFDGTLDPYLDDLYQVGADGLHQIYSHCRGYAGTGPGDRDAIIGYLRAHVLKPDAAYVGAPGRTVGRISREQALRAALEATADALVADRSADQAPAPLRRRLQDAVRQRPDSAWAEEPAPPRITAGERAVRWGRLLGAGLLAVVLLPVLLPLLIVFLVVLRVKERGDPTAIPVPEADQVGLLLTREDRIVQNHMASLSLVKPGRFRRRTLRTVLWATSLIAGVSYKGTLSGLDTLHFAHWVLIDDGQRLLFLTNYDGSWENYLDDFIDRAALGLTGIWSNTVNFPRTRFLVFGGARDEPRFKAIARSTQRYTNVWYSAYPHLTVRAIDNTSSIREDLFRPLGESAARRWLWRL